MHSSQWITIGNQPDQPQFSQQYSTIVTVPIAFSENTRLLLIFHCSLFDRSSFSSSQCSTARPLQSPHTQPAAAKETTTNQQQQHSFSSRVKIFPMRLFSAFGNCHFPRHGRVPIFTVISWRIDRSTRRNVTGAKFHIIGSDLGRKTVRAEVENTASPRRYR